MMAPDKDKWFCLKPYVPKTYDDDLVHTKAVRWFRVKDEMIQITHGTITKPNLQGSRMSLEMFQFGRMLVIMDCQLGIDVFWRGSTERKPLILRWWIIAGLAAFGIGALIRAGGW